MWIKIKPKEVLTVGLSALGLAFLTSGPVVGQVAERPEPQGVGVSALADSVRTANETTIGFAKGYRDQVALNGQAKQIARNIMLVDEGVRYELRAGINLTLFPQAFGLRGDPIDFGGVSEASRLTVGGGGGAFCAG